MRIISLCAAVALAGCATEGVVFEPETLVFDYQIREVPPQTINHWRGALRADERRAADFLRPGFPLCRFQASFADGSAHPELDIMGAPGDAGANLSIAATNPTDAQRDDQGPDAPEDSPCHNAIQYIEILLGPPINPEEEVEATSATIRIDDVDYTTGGGGFIEGTLNGVTARGYASGEFGIIATGGNKVLIIGDGAFAIRD